jgi:integrase
MSAKIVPLRQAGIKRNVTSLAKGRNTNDAYRVREHLTEAEIDKLLAALKRNRHGHRDWLIGLIIYRHGLRVSEACDLRWDHIDLRKRTMIVRRLKGSTDSTHYLERDEHKALGALWREHAKSKSAYVFINERGHPFGLAGPFYHASNASAARWTAFPGSRPHAQALHWIRPWRGAHRRVAPPAHGRSWRHLLDEAIRQRLGKCGDGELLLVAQDGTHSSQNLSNQGGSQADGVRRFYNGKRRHSTVG